MAFVFGIIVSIAWMLVNSFFLIQLVKMAARPLALNSAEGASGDLTKQKNKIFAFSLVKFPLLYLVGFFILRSHFFPVTAILTGLTISLVILTAWWFRMRVA